MMQAGWRTFSEIILDVVVLAMSTARLRFSFKHTKQCVLRVCVDARALVHLFTMRGREEQWVSAGARNGSRVAGA